MGVGSALLEQTKDLQNNKGAGQVTTSPALFVWVLQQLRDICICKYAESLLNCFGGLLICLRACKYEIFVVTLQYHTKVVGID